MGGHVFSMSSLNRVAWWAKGWAKGQLGSALVAPGGGRAAPARWRAPGPVRQALVDGTGLYSLDGEGSEMLDQARAAAAGDTRGSPAGAVP